MVERMKEEKRMKNGERIGIEWHLSSHFMKITAS
jgi:hypothetical protein